MNLQNMSTLARKTVRSVWTVSVLVAVLAFPSSVQASGTVTSPNWANFTNALVGGGTVTLAFNGTLYFSNRVTVAANTVLDATGYTVTLSGRNALQMFVVNSGVTLNLTNLTLANGYTTNSGGAINNAGTVVAYNCWLINNSAVGPNGGNGGNGSNGSAGVAGSPGGSTQGGAIYNSGTLQLYYCLVGTNTATGGNGGNGGNGGSSTSGNGGRGGDGGAPGNAAGGGIYNAANPAAVYLANCTFAANIASGGSGGLGGTGGNATGTFGGDGGNGTAGATGFGGAIYNAYNLTPVNCTFVTNNATGGNGAAGGIYGVGASPGNAGSPGSGGSGSGAGVYNAQNMTMIGCTLYYNVGHSGNGAKGGTQSNGNSGGTGANGAASNGGGLYSISWCVLTNCTFYKNTATGGNGGQGGDGTTAYGAFSQGGQGGNGGSGTGGGLCNTNTITVVDCTFSSSGVYPGAKGLGGTGSTTKGDGSDGSPLGGNLARTSGTFTVKDSILAYAPTGGNWYGSAIVDGGYNLSSDTSVSLTGTGSHSNIDPKISAIAYNGGPTWTCALLSNSPAINTNFDSAAPLVDQRGYVRSGTPDIGAYEYGGTPPPTAEVFALGEYASLDGAVGLFVFDLSTATASSAFTINYIVSGTAGNGVDYSLITNSVTIPQGAAYVTLPIRGIPGAFTGITKTVSLTLQSNPKYQVPYYFGSATVTLVEHANVDASKRFFRGTSTAPDFQSLVVPLDSETGVPLDPIGGNAAQLFPNNPWTNTLNHLDATNSFWDIPFANPIVAFGSPVNGSPLYLSHNYNFGIHAGNTSANLANALRIQVYYRSNSAYVGTISLPIPDVSTTGGLANVVTNGFTQTFQGFGLQTTLLVSDWRMWGLGLLNPLGSGLIFGPPYILTHNASASATNYYHCHPTALIDD